MDLIGSHFMKLPWVKIPCNWTYFKNLHNPGCTDVILSNRPRNFYKSDVIEARLSDFHKMITSHWKCIFKELNHVFCHTEAIKISKMSDLSEIWDLRLMYKIFKRIGWMYFHQSQPVITCSKLTIVTLEQGMKYVQSKQ